MISSRSSIVPQQIEPGLGRDQVIVLGIVIFGAGQLATIERIFCVYCLSHARERMEAIGVLVAEGPGCG